MLRLTLSPCLTMLLNLVAPTPHGSGAEFIAEQRTYPRVRAAYAAQAARLDSLLAVHGLRRGSAYILLTVFKQEKELEVWAKAPTARAYQLLTTLPICRRSGGPGPKRARGDNQTPEGFYTLDRFNPSSNYHLSLGIDYPNAADRQRRPTPADLGGDIFLHGDCVTIGCVPLTDSGIEILYVLAIEARAGGQARLPVYFFPARLTDAKLASLQAYYAEDKPALAAFWQNLKHGYDRFTRTHEALHVRAASNGEYVFD